MFCIRNYWEALIAIPAKVAVSIKAGLTHDEDVRDKLICNNNVVEIKKMDPDKKVNGNSILLVDAKERGTELKNVKISPLRKFATHKTLLP